MFDFNFVYKGSDVHSLHPYPAKFPPSVPHQLLKQFSKGGDVVLDPFSGCGTTLVEGKLNKCHVIGNDINFIALLLSRVKTRTYQKKELNICEGFINDLIRSYVSKIEPEHKMQYDGIDHWFQENVQRELNLIKDKIHSWEKCSGKKKLPELMKVVLSSIIIDVSNQESDTRYAAIDKKIEDGFTIELFAKKYDQIKNKLLRVDYPKRLKVKILSEDARVLKSVDNDSIDLIVTSPPYANTYDYYLYHKHRMLWLDYNFKLSQELEIGSRNEYSSKKRPIEFWEKDIESFLKMMKRVIKVNKNVCLIIGDSVVNKEIFDVRKAIMKIADKLDMNCPYVNSSSMSKNTRKFNHKFRTNYDKQEHLIILSKSI